MICGKINLGICSYIVSLYVRKHIHFHCSRVIWRSVHLRVGLDIIQTVFQNYHEANGIFRGVRMCVWTGKLQRKEKIPL